MEDPTAPQTTEDDEEEEEEQICLRRLTYLMTLPDEVEENSRYLLNWAKVGLAHSSIHLSIGSSKYPFINSSVH